MNPPPLPMEMDKRTNRDSGRRGQDDREHIDPVYTYTCLTNTDTSSQSRDHVIMSELGITFAWNTCSRRSTIDSATFILADPTTKYKTRTSSSWFPNLSTDRVFFCSLGFFSLVDSLSFFLILRSRILDLHARDSYEYIIAYMTDDL